jgi:O-antigen ligase
MEKKNSILVLKGIIWASLAVIIFSPLYVSSKLFFPFITTKTFAFQIAVEVMFLAFLLLCYLDKKYRIHTNIAVILILAYLIILVIASFFGNDFYRSFWSNNERSDGILLLGHLFIFAVVISSFLRTVKEWLYLFDLFILAVLGVALVSIDQFLALTFPESWKVHFLPSSNGVRLAATIGNAGYVGGYMIFGFFISLFMLLKRNNLYLKLSYLIMILITLFITLQTQTRGAYLALAFGGLVMMVYLMWFYFNHKYLKITLVIILLTGLIGVSSIFLFKDSGIVKNNTILNRISSISLTSGTANNRMVTWVIGWKVFQERPLFGYGQENFYQGFDKYYNTKNTEEWFDRCHNMVCDRAITGGIVGLIGYLAMLIIPFFVLWNFYWRKYNNLVEAENKYRRFLTPIIFSILIVAYIIQNLFIFEALVTYVPLIMILSFAGVYGKTLDFKVFDQDNVKLSLIIIFAVLIVPFLWFFNLKPLYANADFIKILSSQSAVSYDRLTQSFEEVISRNTYGNQEYRRHYFNFYEKTYFNILNNEKNKTEVNQKNLASFTGVMEKNIDEQLAENPYSVANHLMALRFYNLAYVFDPLFFDKAIKISERTKELSIGRPQVHYEVASLYYYYANYSSLSGRQEEAGKYFVKSVENFYQGVEKNVDPNRSFSELSGFLMAIKRDRAEENALAIASYSPELAVSLVDKLLSDLGEIEETMDETQNQEAVTKVKEISEWLLKADSDNTQLLERLNKLK